MPRSDWHSVAFLDDGRALARDEGALRRHGVLLVGVEVALRRLQAPPRVRLIAVLGHPCIVRQLDRIRDLRHTLENGRDIDPALARHTAGRRA